MRIRMLLITSALALFSTPSWAVNCCSVNGGICNIIPPLTHGQSGWTGAVCGTTLSGTNCTAKLDADVSAASGDCLTLGSGVTLDLNGHAIACTGSCGSAVTNTASGATSAAVTITNGRITGAWTTGVNVSGGSNSSVSELLVDGAYVGLSKVRGTIDHTVVRNCSYIGIDLQGGEDLKTVVLRNNGNTAYEGYGVWMTGAIDTSVFDNVLFIGNYRHTRWVAGNGFPDVQRSEFQNAVDCDCHYSNFLLEACVSAQTFCFDFTNGGTPTKVGDAFVP